MWQIMVYAVALSTALSLLGHCEEKLAAMLGKPRRFVWALSLAASVLWPAAAIMWSRPAAISAPVAEQAIAYPSAMPELPLVTSRRTPTSTATSPPASLPMTSTVKPATTRLRTPSDRTLLVTWALLSGLMLLYLLGADLSLRRRTARWRHETICDQPVRISSSTGPALIGTLRPAIVVPGWFVDEPAATQFLVLEHELQHIRARDPLLLRLAFLVVAAAPWNLPLWWQLRRLRHAIELDCDARVIGAGAEAASYGKVLLAVTQRAGNMPLGAVAMSEPVSALEWRICNLDAGPARYSAPRTVAAIALWCAGFGVAVSLEAPPAPIARPAPALPATAAKPATAAQADPAPTAITPSVQSRQPVKSGAAPGTDVQPATATGFLPLESLLTSPAPTTSAPAAPAQNTPVRPLDVQPGNPDLSVIPSNLLQRMDVVTGGASATYGSGAMAGVVNLVLNNRLTGFKLDASYGINEADITQRRGAAELVLQDLRRRFGDNSPRVIAQKKLVGDLRTQESGLQRPQIDNPMDVRALINQMSEIHGGKFVVDPRVSGPVELGAVNPNDPDSLEYHVFLVILGAHGFIAVRSDDAVTILPSQYARTVASPTIRLDLDENLYMGDEAEVVTAVIPVQSLGGGMANPQMLARSLAPLVSPWGYLAETHDNSGLLIVDKVANIKRIIELSRGKRE